MSSESRESYRGKAEVYSFASSDDESVRRRGFAERAKRLETHRADVGKKDPKKRVVRAEEEVYDDGSVKLKITKPGPDIKRVHIVMVDNSGSNRAIAEHLRSSSGYLMETWRMLDPESQVAFIYFSDHCDGDGIIQEIDFVSPGEEGDRVLLSTLRHVRSVSGGDEAEAIECAMVHACNIDFAGVPEKHLYLVTDVVAHGMGMADDNGCPLQQDWRKSLRSVNETFTTFEVIGSGQSAEDSKLQEKFLNPARLAWDLIDLSSIKEVEHRRAITGNALLFLVARRRGLQAVELFLSFLYEKWLADPIFGSQTDRRAREMIERFGKYLEIEPDKLAALMNKVFGK